MSEPQTNAALGGAGAAREERAPSVENLRQAAEELKEISEKLELEDWERTFDQWAKIFRLIMRMQDGVPAYEYNPLTVTIDDSFHPVWKVIFPLPGVGRIVLIQKTVNEPLTVDEINDAIKRNMNVIIREFITDLRHFAEDVSGELREVLNRLEAVEEQLADDC